jgi:integrase/recombinase XerC
MDGTRLGLAEAVEAAAEWVSASWAAEVEARRVVGVLQRFASFCDQGFGIVDLEGVTPGVAAEFVSAPAPGGANPSVSLRHLRRLSIRLLFRVARSSGHLLGDPTLDLALPPRSSLSTRPLADEEVLVCRGAAQWSLEDTRRASAWALAEATCRTAELPFITVADIDVERSRVWIHGGGRAAERWGYLDDWGIEQIGRRLAVVGEESAVPIVYGGGDPAGAGQVAACTVIQEVIVRAGLGDEPDVRASSVSAWAGRRILAESGRIDVVARRLGLKSLDRAARIIAWDWLEEPDP